jgi:hypothetical protein
MFRKDTLLAEIEKIKHEPGAEHRNRLGVLLGNKATENDTKTLTHILWSLLNELPAKNAQRPHRHNSVALDLCVSGIMNSMKLQLFCVCVCLIYFLITAAAAEGVYTLMGPELDESGWVKNPVRCDWKTVRANRTLVIPYMTSNFILFLFRRVEFSLLHPDGGTRITTRRESQLGCFLYKTRAFTRTRELWTSGFYCFEISYIFYLFIALLIME